MQRVPGDFERFPRVEVYTLRSALLLSARGAAPRRVFLALATGCDQCALVQLSLVREPMLVREVVPLGLFSFSGPERAGKGGKLHCALARDRCTEPSLVTYIYT